MTVYYQLVVVAGGTVAFLDDVLIIRELTNLIFAVFMFHLVILKTEFKQTSFSQ